MKVRPTVFYPSFYPEMGSRQAFARLLFQNWTAAMRELRQPLYSGHFGITNLNARRRTRRQNLSPIRTRSTAMLDAVVRAQVSIESVPARRIAAVRRLVRIGEVSRAWRPALDKVWEFLRQNPGLRTDGHNIFLYHHPPDRQMPMEVDFGVEVVRSFDVSGEVYLTETPAGRVAAALHVGPYECMSETHEAIHAWAAANQQSFAGKSWEIYGDPTDDSAKLETRLEYLLSRVP